MRCAVTSSEYGPCPYSAPFEEEKKEISFQFVKHVWLRWSHVYANVVPLTKAGLTSSWL